MGQVKGYTFAMEWGGVPSQSPLQACPRQLRYVARGHCVCVTQLSHAQRKRSSIGCVGLEVKLDNLLQSLQAVLQGVGHDRASDDIYNQPQAETRRRVSGCHPKKMLVK